MKTGDRIEVTKSDFVYRVGRRGEVLNVDDDGLVRFKDDLSGSVFYTHTDDSRVIEETAV